MEDGCQAGKCPPGGGHPFFKVVEVSKILASLHVGADHKCWTTLNHFLSVPKSAQVYGLEIFRELYFLPTV